MVTQTEFSPSVISTHTTLMPSRVDPKEQERKNLEFLMQPWNSETQQKVKLMEERLKAIEGNNSKKGMDVVDLSLILDVVIPYKSKISDFIKYNGNICLRAHMKLSENG